MKELIKVGFNKGLVVGVAIVTASAVLKVVSIPKHVIMYALEKNHQDLKNSKEKEEEEEA
jgi:type IV secretory pathway VirB3-like protein